MFPQIFGKYVLEAELAAGGMARVYLATLRGADGFEKRLVVKQIRPELASDEAFVERFVEEAKTAVELSHPNIVPVYELGVEQGVYYIAMERCEGGTLAELLDATGPLSPEEGAHLGAEVCRALDYAHRKAGVIHRDVTPRNVLIDEEGAVRLIDFGIAAPAEEPGARGKNEIFGSPGHMPPEQIRGEALTPATDVFATAALLMEAWTGEPPFRRATARESHRALHDTPPDLGEAVPALAPVSDVIRRALSLDPTGRPKDAEHLGRPLRDLLRHADSVDVARRLGERVHRVHRLRSVPPPSDGSPASELETPNTRRINAAPRTPASASRTFAARPDLVEWTRRLSSAPPAPDTAVPSGGTPNRSAPGSQRSSTPSVRAEGRGASSGAAALRARNAPVHARRGVPAWSRRRFGLAAGAVAVSLGLGAWWAGSAGRRSASVPRPPSGAPASEPRVAAPGGGSVSFRTAAAKQQAASSPAPGDVRARDPDAERSIRAPSQDAAARAEPAGLPSASPLRNRLSGAAVPLGSAPPGPASAPSPSPNPPPSGSLVGAPETAFALLKLTSAPPASVTVAGRAYTTPVAALRLPAGSHRVTFRNETWEGPVSTQVVLKAGDHRSVHADFTSEPPRVIVR